MQPAKSWVYILRYPKDTDLMYYSGKDSKQPGRHTPAAGKVGRRGPTVGYPARVHVPLLVGQLGRDRARDVPRAVNESR